MFANYFVTAINNLVKNKLYSAINILGLAIGLAACIVIALYVKDEFSYDQHWENSERMYRVNLIRTLPGQDSTKFPMSAITTLPVLAEYFSDEIELSTRAYPFPRVIEIGTLIFEDTLINVDPAFADMFELEVLAGSMQETLSSIDNIALREDAALRYYGAKNPIGEMLTVNSNGQKRDYIVSAVYRVPNNTFLDLPLISRLNEPGLPPGMLANWFGNATFAFIQLKPGVDIATLTPRLQSLIDENVDASRLIPGSNIRGSDVLSLEFQNIETIHLNSPWDTQSAGGNKTVVFAFAAIAALVLIIGCINFTILTTAKATQRAREVAMRKALGARRKQLIVQFLGESFVIVLLAMALSLAIVQLMLPVFESMVGKSLAMSYSSPLTYLSLLGLLVVVSVSGGLYPAFILSSFRPSATLKANRSAETKGSALLRHVLVTFQFSVSIILIIATGVIYAQIQYSSNRDPGYNKDNLLVITQLGPRPDLNNRVETLKQELLGSANISDVSFSQMQPSQLQDGLGIYTLAGGSGANLTIATSAIGYDYFDTYQIPLIAGRDFDLSREGPETQQLPERRIIINESAVRALGLSSPEAALGQVLSPPGGNAKLTIIGVVADSHLLSINALPEPTVFQLFTLRPNVISVRYLGSREAIVNQVGSVWRNVMGGAELYTAFVDQLVLAEFAQAQVEAEILISFSLLAIFIACLGLFGSVSFTVDRRTKEIGLRKVMGAKVKNIVSLLLWQFTKPVLLANLFAWPIAIWIMLDWLQRFPYQIDTWLLGPLCFAAGLIALIIAWLTVLRNTTRVARNNPIHALRYE